YCRAMKNSLIRRARIEDAETIAVMVAALSREEGEPPPRFDAAICRRDGFGDRPIFTAWLAALEGRVAGYALHHRSYDTVLLARVVAEPLDLQVASAQGNHAPVRAGQATDWPHIASMIDELLRAVGEPVFGFDATARVLADGFGAAPRFQTLIAERGGVPQ